jgi:Zn finger protein HypA/HybF involved in hydrogenase expression
MQTPLLQIGQHYFIPLTHIQKELGITDILFSNHVEQYQYKHKGMENDTKNGICYISCKSACHFLSWYLDNSYRVLPNISNFKHALSKYIRKIPKRILSRSMRIEIAYRQNYACKHCNLFPIPPDFHVDHIIELQDGGQDIAENLQALCPQCHSKKTRLNRLRKTSIFQSQVTPKYEEFVHVPQKEDKPIFSKYFSEFKQ